MRQVVVPRDLPPALRISAASGLVVQVLDGETMGTTWAIKFVVPKSYEAVALRADVVRVLDCIVAQMSTWIAGSDISRFNHAVPATWHELPVDFFEVLRYALTVSRDTAGAFDPTIGALVDLWGFGPAGRRDTLPDEHAIENARSGWSRLKLADGRRVFQPGGAQLDLSGVAKGYAVDRVAEVLLKLGIVNHLVEIGGELRGSGVKPDGTPWWVALDGAPGIEETVVALHGVAVATSGDGQRFFIHGGRRLSHTVDPRNGRPVSERLAAVTVLHRSCMCADALATALIVLGSDGGIDYANVCGIAARFVLRRSGRFEERVTRSFAAMRNRD